jgi:hypothetical protein
MFFSSTVFVLSRRGLRDGPIPGPEESYRLWCVSECDQVENRNPRHLLWVGRRGKEYETRQISDLSISAICLPLQYPTLQCYRESSLLLLRERDRPFWVGLQISVTFNLLMLSPEMWIHLVFAEVSELHHIISEISVYFYHNIERQITEDIKFWNHFTGTLL